MFSGRDKDWLGHAFSCRDIIFLCRDRVGNGGEALCRIELVMVERLYVVTELIYVWTECGQRERFGVETGNFMLQHSYPGWGDFMSRQSFSSKEKFCCNQRIYVTIELAMTETLYLARQALGAHNRDAHATKGLCRDRYFAIATYLYSDKNK